eukprot:335717-Alexandrium_andersonii.AAC.1
MSASLVGSEMCIRDRLTGAPSCLKLLNIASSCLTSLRAASRVVVPLSVSYTHLTLPTICSV